MRYTGPKKLVATHVRWTASLARAPNPSWPETRLVPVRREGGRKTSPLIALKPACKSRLSLLTAGRKSDITFTGGARNRRWPGGEKFMQATTDNVTASRPMIVTTTENIPDTRVVKTIGQVPMPRRQHRRRAQEPRWGRDQVLRQAQRGFAPPGARPHGAKRRRNGGQRRDNDALRLHRNGPEHVRDRGVWHCPCGRVAPRALHAMNAQS